MRAKILTVLLAVGALAESPHSNEVVTSCEHGSFAFQELQLFRKAGAEYIPHLRGRMINRTDSYWQNPRFRFKVAGKSADTGELTPVSYDFQIEIPGMSAPGDWFPINHVLIEYKIPPFAVESYEVALIGGQRQRTEEEKALAAAAEQKAVVEQQVQRKAESRAAANRKKKEAEAAWRAVQQQREREAREQRERDRLIQACRAIYNQTIDKKVNDLTVKEAQQVQACQAIGAYIP